MFDLEQQISKWRKQMLAAGIQSPVPLEELELHLREEIEWQKKTGLSEQEAFKNSVQQIGQPHTLKTEFNQIEPSFMKTFFTSVTVLLLGIAAQVPGSLQLREQLVMSDKWLGLWLLGSVLQMGSLVSLRQIIQPKLTGRALKTVEWIWPKANLKTGAGVAVLLAGIGLLIPAVTQAVCNGWVAFDALCGFVFGTSLLIVGAAVTCFPYQRRAVTP